VSGRLPNLVIIGAAKCGTTSLHNYLQLHPSIFMSQTKELKLFNREDWRDHLGWYRAQFSTELPVRGESSPTYTMYPKLDSVAERMHAVIPDARLIYVVRDPIERLVAQYVEHVHISMERRPLEEALADYESPDNLLVLASRYAHQLDRFREFFPDSSILVLDQRDLLESRATTLRKVFGFLGVDSDFSSPEFTELHNLREQKLRLTRAALWIHDRGLLHPLRRRSRVLPTTARERVKTLLTEPVDRPVLDPAQRGQVAAFLREDAERLRAYTGNPFAHWSI
jgi:hypothetical protein